MPQAEKPYLAFLSGLRIHFLLGNKPSVNQDGNSEIIKVSLWVKKGSSTDHH